jgi:hypothetical protein
MSPKVISNSSGLASQPSGISAKFPLTARRHSNYTTDMYKKASGGIGGWA